MQLHELLIANALLAYQEIAGYFTNEGLSAFLVAFVFVAVVLVFLTIE